MKTILVTGGAGFLGTVVVQKLVELISQLRIIVLSKVDTGKKPSLQPRYHHVHITVLEEVIKAFRVTSPDTVIHAAGLIPSPSERYQRVTDDLSSSFANVQAEKLVLNAPEHDFKTCILRPSVIFGENDDHLIPSIHACLGKAETPYIIGDGMNLWHVDCIGNVVDAHVLAMENLASGEIAFVQNDEKVPF